MSATHEMEKLVKSQRELIAELERRLQDTQVELARREMLYAELAQRHMNLQLQMQSRRIQAEMIGNLINGHLHPGRQQGQQFDKAEIDRLLRLCHPDKHGNSEASNEITRKLLKLRG